MATYEANAVEMALRAEARKKLEELAVIAGQLAAGMDLDERLELGGPLAQLRRVLQGDTPPLALGAPGNVRPLRGCR